MLSAWQNNQSATLPCVEKWQETPDTVSFRLAISQSQQHSEALPFKPGQFINLGVSIDGKTHFRSYSLSSIPSDPYLQFTVKKVDAGLVSTYLVEELSVGEELEVMSPVGSFNCIDNPPKNKVLLVSAGCGITPVYSMAKHWLAEQCELDIQFLHVAKDLERTIYAEQLEMLDQTHSAFHLSLLLKDASGTDYPQGRLNKQWLQTLVPDLVDRTVYLCGPSNFMQDVQSWMEQLGLDLNHFYQESFTPEPSFQAPVSEATGQSEVAVTAPQFGREFTALQGANLAEEMEAQGLPLVIACRSGMCGSCKCKVKGEVSSTSQETLTPDEIEAGYVLACSSTIDGDLEVEIG
ncbi:hybrid-cluster NAD(P)-dependent oxidoreductase [Vibrio sp. SCSIO 43136]|uniref:hybrid-cluster NAD(P)-dependent oxidoreductase n=1 Tax=Vibrio sp. SCSIO 43136 TaxID=2819101 RepID=UPI002075ADB2|nr:hybrid-cluster NAD(P)-dependent oxidoreductase [Vibrio sp. SCSIO 43136]USD67605.1 hybrid-cluster NAD(P)-dependent oxidoreductase [Vibrio sp. SCSIO 43136]